MGISEYAAALLDEMEDRLAEISSKEPDYTRCYRNSASLILQFISKIKKYTTDHTFENKNEEIHFFKNIKPGFLSKLIYNQKVFAIQAGMPVVPEKEIKYYYSRELHKINTYFKDNREFYFYYKSGSADLDEMYFIRKEPGSWLLMNFDDYETDLNFTTFYDYKLSKIMAFGMLAEFINERVARLDIKKGTATNGEATTQTLTWTASKVSLVELLYALQSSGTCNNGAIDVRQLAIQLEHFFNIDLGNYYRVFQEMRIRKISRTSFLDQLKDRLVQRMDEQDENPKRYDFIGGKK